MIKNRKVSLKCICCLLIITSSSVFSQEKMDKVTMLDKVIKVGCVRSVDLENIKFEYTGEEVEYTISKKDINKIEFANGRVEIINPVKVSALHSTLFPSIEGKHKIGVFPFSIISNDERIQEDVLKIKMQNQVADILKEEIYDGLIVQNPATINALLAENDISRASIANLLPEDLASVLGVEYVIYCTASIINERWVNYESNSTKHEENGFIYSNPSSTDLYNVEIEFKIYDWNGIHMYSDSIYYSSVGIDMVFSYKDRIREMIKHSPLGIKY